MKWYLILLIVVVVAIGAYYVGHTQGKKKALAGTVPAGGVGAGVNTTPPG